jgi:hypothetical protein
MQNTTVVNLKIAAYDVYIGRKMPGKAASIWENPYEIGRDGARSEVIEKYETYIKNTPNLIAQLPSLKGLRLGCWCKPNPCHGDVLVRLLEGAPPSGALQFSLF